MSLAACRSREPSRPFRIALDGEVRPAGHPVARLARWLGPPVESLLAFPELNRIYRGLGPGTRESFCERALAALDVDYDVADSDVRRIPRAGPLVVVANHPFGGLDGLVLAALLRRVRPDVKLLANHLLGWVPELRDMLFLVDPFGSDSARARNLGALRAALKWVRDGGALGVFPAGEVSHLSLRRRAVADPPWSDAVGRLVSQTGAAALPVFFEGRNSALFQALGLVHPRLRTALLPRELLSRRHSRVRVHIGTAVSAARLATLGDGAATTSYLRVRTEILRGRAGPASRRDAARPPRRVPMDPVAPPECPEAVAAEVAALPDDQRLADSGPLEVVHARAAQIPCTLREIGRLREIAFRGAGEGTGRPADLDRFDRFYAHLFLWHRQRREVVGAYRLGLTDEILPRGGPAGLYTSTLFRYRGRLLDEIGPSIELGRSFVRVEWQKEYAPLMLLWRGIARFVARHPRYKVLFGPVSISNEYRTATRQLLVAFLRLTAHSTALAGQVRPRNTAAPATAGAWDPKLVGTVARSMEEVDELVGEIEAGRLGVPVLLRQYLKLNAKLLGFNVDPAFANVLDALMLVDLTQVPRAILTRYMGPESLARFLAYHGVPGR